MLIWLKNERLLATQFAWLAQIHASLPFALLCIHALMFQKMAIKLFTVWNVEQPVGLPHAQWCKKDRGMKQR